MDLGSGKGKGMEVFDIGVKPRGRAPTVQGRVETGRDGCNKMQLDVHVTMES